MKIFESEVEMTDKEIVERIARDGSCEFTTCDYCPLEKWCKDFWSAKALANTWLIQKERERLNFI